MKIIVRCIKTLFWAALFWAVLSLIWVLYTPDGAHFVIRQTAEWTLGVKKVSWQAIEGSLVSGIRVAHLEVRDIPYLPPGNFLRLQSVSVRLTAPRVEGFQVAVDNGRLFLHGDEPIVFNARFSDGNIQANVYAEGLNLADVRGVLVQFFDVPPFKGTLKGIDLYADGVWQKPHVHGKFVVDRIVQNEFILEKAPVTADLNFKRGRPRWETYGSLLLDRGWLRSPILRVALRQSRLTFTGRPSKPGLDISAVTRVARTRIDITVRGTRDEPKVSLSSEPSYSKEHLLLMLATGKRWSGIQETMSRDQQNPELTANFADYLLFGGSRAKFVRLLGLSDVSLQADNKRQGVLLSKDLTPRLGIGYGVEMTTDTHRQREVTQRLQSEYQLTDNFMLGVQKEFKPFSPSTESTGQGGADALGIPADSSSYHEAPDDRVYLKYRSSF